MSLLTWNIFCNNYEDITYVTFFLPHLSLIQSTTYLRTSSAFENFCFSIAIRVYFLTFFFFFIFCSPYFSVLSLFIFHTPNHIVYNSKMFAGLHQSCSILHPLSFVIVTNKIFAKPAAVLNNLKSNFLTQPQWHRKLLADFQRPRTI